MERSINEAARAGPRQSRARRKDWRFGLRRLHGELQSAQAELLRELQIVGAIQRSLLPESLPALPGLDIGSYYQPSALAGGDYYDIVPLEPGQWGLVMADVAGHGASAAVIMAVMRTLVHAHLPHTKSMPAHGFLEFINRQMTGDYIRDGRFVTVWCAMLEPDLRRITYSCAGHNPPRLVRRGKIIPLDAVNGLPIGIDGEEHYAQFAVNLEPGDLIVIYTDGITEAMRRADTGRELFDTHRLDRVLTECGPVSAQECIQRIADSVHEFTEGNEQSDDQTMLVIRVV